ncbi:MAG: class I SAM-dependent methyltransferase [Chloroflexota bacterium]
MSEIPPLDQIELDRWFEANQVLLETVYLQGITPWQQSGFGLHTPHTAEQWRAHRQPIAECVDRSGSFLDIGCANGYLLECLLAWTSERGLSIDPYGLDLSSALIALARERLRMYAGQLWVANAWNWMPPRRFTWVRTELVYVPDALHSPYVDHLLDHYLAPGGRLLVCEYRGRSDSRQTLDIDDYLSSLGKTVDFIRAGSWEGREVVRVSVLTSGNH